MGGGPRGEAGWSLKTLNTLNMLTSWLKTALLSPIPALGDSKMRDCRQFRPPEARPCETVGNYGPGKASAAVA